MTRHMEKAMDEGNAGEKENQLAEKKDFKDFIKAEDNLQDMKIKFIARPRSKQERIEMGLEADPYFESENQQSENRSQFTFN